MIQTDFPVQQTFNTRAVERWRSFTRDMGDSSRQVYQPLKRETRLKAAVVLYFVENNQIYILLVKNSKANDWSFITGGCKKSENVRRCALREFREETLKLFDEIIDPNLFTDRLNFQHGEVNPVHARENRSRGQEVTYYYHMFFAPLKNFSLAKARILESRYSSMSSRRNENIEIRFVPYDSKSLSAFMIWNIAQQQIYSPRFSTALYTEAQINFPDQQILQS